MRKYAVTIIAVIIGGILGGLLNGYLRPEPAVDDQSAVLEELRAKLGKSEAKYLDALKAHEELQNAYRSLKDAGQNAPKLAVAAKEVDVSAFMAEIEEELLAEAPEQENRFNRRRGGDQDQPEESEEDRAAREEEMANRRQQWEDFREQRRVEREDSFTNAIVNAKDLESQERIEAIQNYQDYFGELRDAMRNAETDEDRQLMREEMVENVQNYRELVDTQRNEMIRDIAAQSGITSAAKQDQFIQSYNELQRDPLFNSGGMGWGGGGYMGGGFGGPGRGRGGR